MTSVFKALADPTRRKVLDLLKKEPMSAGDIASHFNVSKPTMSAHFGVLKEADLVHTERQGKQIIYHLKMSVLEEALLGLAGQFGIGLPGKPEARPAAKGESST